MTLAELAQLAVQHLRPELLLLGGKAAEGAATETGKQLIAWFREHLKSPAAQTALADAAIHPDDARRLDVLRLQVEILLEEHESFRRALAAILKDHPVQTLTHQTATSSGGSTVIQVVGDSNTINGSREKLTKRPKIVLRFQEKAQLTAPAGFWLDNISEIDAFRVMIDTGEPSHRPRIVWQRVEHLKAKTQSLVEFHGEMGDPSTTFQTFGGSGFQAKSNFVRFYPDSPVSVTATIRAMLTFRDYDGAEYTSCSDIHYNRITERLWCELVTG